MKKRDYTADELRGMMRLICGVGIAIQFALLFTMLFVVSFDAYKAREANMAKIDRIKAEQAPIVVVKYTVEYGSIYTGGQTPIKHRGESNYRHDEKLNVGPNGLPVIGAFPEHAPLPVTLNNGEQCILRVPVVKPELVAVLDFQNGKRVYMAAKIIKKDGAVFVEAVPATKKQLEFFEKEASI